MSSGVPFLPAVPTFGTMIGQALGGGLGEGLSEGLNSQLKEFQRQKQSRTALEGLKPLFKQADINFSPEEEEAFVKSGLDPSIAAVVFGNIYKQKAAQAKAEREELKTQKEKEGAQKGLQNVFDNLGKMISENAPGIGISPSTKLGLNREGVQNRSKFDNLTTKLESALLPLVNKGALSKERFNYIISRLPKSSDSQRVIVGKLQGLAESLTEDGIPVDVSSLENIFAEREKQAEMSNQIPTATNKKTGAKVIFKDGKWQPVQ